MEEEKKCASCRQIKMEITEKQKSKLLEKVDEINDAEGFRDSYDSVRILCGELKSMIEML